MMKKILFLLLAAVSLAACEPDNWITDNDKPGSGTTGGTTGGGTSSDDDDDNGSGSGTNIHLYTLNEVTKKLSGSWSLSMDNMFLEWYHIQSDMEVEFAAAYDENAERNWGMHMWREGKFTNMQLAVDGDRQILTVTYSFKFYSYHYDTEQWETGSSTRKIQIDATSLMEKNKLYTSDYSFPYERDSKNYNFKAPF